jgi:SAM-dependent methyltransferase
MGDGIMGNPRGGLEQVVDELYRQRFPEVIRERRNAVWKVLCGAWFDRYIPEGARVLEVGAGYCEFINNCRAGARFAVDLNPETRLHASADVVVHEIGAESLSRVVAPGSIDVAFMSNFLEHCRTRDQVLDVLREVRQVLRPQGKVLILGPNFSACAREYYDYFDHHLPLTERAVVEALGLADLEAIEVRPRTLPFSFKSKLPSWPWLVRAYLRMSWAWRFFGAQFFVVGRKVARARQRVAA